MTGDSRLVSVNPIRDTLFASNPDLYYLIGNVLTIAASLILTGGMAANAAVSAGTSIGRAVVTEYAKQGLTVAASSYVDKRMTEATNSPLAGFVVGSLTGMATYGTLSELDSMANVSGLHSSFAEGMSKEDAQKYLDFLENGSKEGLTEAEIRGIGKVDEALALKKVNPEELLELRKQQLGNVGESGRNTAQKVFTDNPFDEAGNLKPNISYQTGEFKYNYETDANGRISNWNTDNLQLTKRNGRLKHNPNTPGKIAGDYAGHLAGDRFGGSPNLDNIVSPSKDVNLSQYKKIENQWAKAISEGKK